MNKKILLVGIYSLIISIAFVILILVLPFDIENLLKISNVNSNIATILTLPVTLLSAILLYMALKEQIKANEITREQNYYSKFFSLYEMLNSRVSHFKIENSNHRGYDVFPVILKDIKHYQMEYAKEYIIKIFSDIPEKIESHTFITLMKFQNTHSIKHTENIEKAKILKAELLSQEDKVYWIQTKFSKILGIDVYSGNDGESAKFKKHLVENYFFKMQNEFRMDIYYNAFRTALETYKIIINTYIDNCAKIISLVSNFPIADSQKKEYLRNIFSREEKILLYQYYLTGFIDQNFAKDLVKYSIFTFVLDRDYFILTMTNERFKIDRDYVLSLIKTPH